MINALLQYLIPDGEGVREKWIVDRLKTIKPRSKILDAGAGQCRYKKYCSHLKYISQDLAEYNGEDNKKGIHTSRRDYSSLDIRCDIVDIPVKSGSFDNVLCTEVFEHIPNPIDAIKEISRVMKTNGVLLLTAPFSSLTHYSPYYYYSGFSENFYKELLPKYGFDIEEIFIYGNYFNLIAIELARVPLVCLRMNKVGAFFLLLFFPLLFPAYLLLILLGSFYPESKHLLSYGICVKAKKIE